MVALVRPLVQALARPLVAASGPASFLNWANFGLGVDGGGNITSSFDIDTLKPWQTGSPKEYMVSYSAGNNANAGTSWALPLKTMAAALGKSDWDIITVDETAGKHYGAEGSLRAGSVTRANPGLIRSRFGGKFDLIDSRNPTAGAYVAQTWTLESGAAYKTVSPTVTSGGALVIDMGIIDANGFPAFYPAVASIAAVIATPGSCFRDSATSAMYVQTSNSRNIIGDQNIIIVDTSNNFTWAPATSGSLLFIENCRFIGGARAFRTLGGTLGQRFTLCLKNVDMFGAGGSNLLGVVGGFDCYLQDCSGAGSVQDVFNYHYDTTSLEHPRIFELRCKTGYTGYDGSGNNNGSTTHNEGGYGGLSVRALGTYNGAADRTIHDGGPYSWLAGCTIKAPTGPVVTTPATVRSGAGNTMWLDRCTVEHRALNTADLYVEALGTMNVATNMDISGLTSTGVIQRYGGL